MVKPTFLIVISCVAATVGCRSAPRAPNACLRAEYLTVRNETGEPVDIYQLHGTTTHVVGTAGVGKTELQLPADIDGNTYFQGRRARDGAWIPSAEGGRSPSSRLSIQVECTDPRS
jgi:hypothetical protein